MHLGRVYRKLGIGSRAELPAGLAGVPDRDVRAAA
jgi:DNA-binding CsgD family transcriptional regulator